MFGFAIRKTSARLLVVAVALLTVSFTAASAEAQSTRQLRSFEVGSHVLNRLAFGPTTNEVPYVARMGWKEWVEGQLNPTSIDDKEVQELLGKKCPSLKMTVTKLQAFQQLKGQERQREKRRIKKELADSVLLRAVYSKRQFNEVIVEFWRNHFSVDVNKVPFLATSYEENVLRQHAFGTFEDLLLATAKHPAMLFYLDNYVSKKGNLNENYARELMELHTLGVDNGYTQADVIELARVLTGWTCGWRGRGAQREYRHFFNAAVHDSEPATVVGLNLAGTGGEADGEKAIRHLARHQNTARFISAKLCRYLVHDQPPVNLVDRVSAVFQKTGGDLREVYRAIIFSPEFMDGRNYRAKFKTPFEFLVSTLRTTDAQIQTTDRLIQSLKLMGQPIYECLEPTGYYDQAEAWLDPGVMIYRWNFALDLVRQKVKGVKIGKEFAEKVLLRPSSRSQAGMVIRMVMPGNNDVSTERLVARATDIRVMVAAALGSPGFQQQ